LNETTEFTSFLGGAAAAWPLAVCTQQWLIDCTPLDVHPNLLRTFRRGLNRPCRGPNVAIEYGCLTASMIERRNWPLSGDKLPSLTVGRGGRI
jgi:hypothetical protein